MKPAVARVRRLEAIREGVDPDRQAKEPETVEEQLEYLRRIGVVGVPDTPEG